MMKGWMHEEGTTCYHEGVSVPRPQDRQSSHYTLTLQKLHSTVARMAAWCKFSGQISVISNLDQPLCPLYALSRIENTTGCGMPILKLVRLSA